MGDLTSKWPVRADHRFLLKLVKILFGGKVVPRVSEFDTLSARFTEEGGSWRALFEGSLSEISKLRKILKAAYEAEELTRSEDWK
jgi:hypothetical protein